MSQLYLFALASQHSRWLSARQAAVAGNVANANTPGYKAQEVAPFEAAMDSVRNEMTATNPKHMSLGETRRTSSTQTAEQPEWETMHSGNSVSLEQELIKAGEINRSYRLNTSVVKSFHRMMLNSTKV
jgi:flagellar basal-body rod protein FlgB